ncbi:MAG: hypothetical protein AAFZ89_01710 [Bacteroidota bacterium]
MFSTKGAGGCVLIEGTTEVFSNNFEFGKVNAIGLGSAVFSSNLGTEFIGNAFSLTLNNNFQTNSFDETMVNFAVGRANSNSHSGLGKFSDSFGGKGSINVLTYTFNLAGQTGTKFLGNTLINE